MNEKSRLHWINNIVQLSKYDRIREKVIENAIAPILLNNFAFVIAKIKLVHNFASSKAKLLNITIADRH